MSDGTLGGRKALVTGGSRGIGAASARRLAAAGAGVALAYVHSAERAAALVDELAAAGVRAAAFRAEQSDDDAGRAVLAAIPMGRYARPEEVASAVAFLAGPEAGYVTGTALRVDGGWST